MFNNSKAKLADKQSQGTKSSDTESKINYMKLAREDYNEHVKPLQAEVKRLTKARDELYGKAYNGITCVDEKARQMYVKVFVEVKAKQKELERTMSQHEPDIELDSLARELDSIKQHNESVTVLEELDMKISECTALVSKYESLRGGIYNVPTQLSGTSSSLFVISSNLNELMKMTTKKDKRYIDSIKGRFFDRYYELKDKRQKDAEMEKEYSEMFKQQNL